MLYWEISRNKTIRLITPSKSIRLDVHDLVGLYSSDDLLYPTTIYIENHKRTIADYKETGLIMSVINYLNNDQHSVFLKVKLLRCFALFS